jgi:ketosteroid isomerase-like protein
MALDNTTPDVDSSAGGVADGGGGDTGGSAGDPTLAAMEEIMRAEDTLDAESGFELAKAPEPGVKPGEAKKPDEAASKTDEPAPGAKKPDEAAAKPPDPATEAAPTEIAPPALDVAAETKRLRKENLRLISDRQTLVQKTNEANQAIERAKTFEADALAYRNLEATVAADPIAFVLKYGKLGDGEEGVQKLLDKVIEMEKSPTERRLEALERERKEERAAAEKAETERRERAAMEADNRAIATWKDNTANFAKTDPDKYDLINSLDMGPAVVEACLEYHRIHKVLPTAEVAADFVERRLRAGVKQSKFIKGLSAASTPAAPAATQSKAAPSNGTPAPKQSGSSTLTDVASGSSAPSAAEYPQDDLDRHNAVLAEMRAAGEI